MNSLRDMVKIVQEQLQVNPTCLVLLKEEKEVGREFKRVSYLGGNVVGSEKQGYMVKARR